MTHPDEPQGLPSDDIVSWVAQEILPLETELRHWLRRMRVAETDDLVQEIYCRLLRLEHFDHIDDPRAYVFRMARNIIVDDIRKKTVVRFETAQNLEGLSVADTAPSPETVAFARAELRWVLGLVAALPERCKKVFELRKVYGLSQAEAAQSLSLSENIIEKETARGLTLMSDMIKRAGIKRRAEPARPRAGEGRKTHV